MNYLIDLIHNNDKTATYKLALLRALTEIALTQPQVAVCKSDGTVHIPYAPIVDLWIIYYYPLLLKGEPQLPQGRTPSFAKTLLRLGRKCRATSGEEVLKKASKLSDLRKEIQEVIRKGPIFYTRNPQNAPIFEEYKRESGRFYDGLVVPNSIWKELCDTGKDTREALLTVWVNLSVTFSTNVPEQI